MKPVTIIIFAFFLSVSVGCKKYLDAKPDKKWVVPESLQDFSNILDFTPTMNISAYPYSGEVASDDYYVSYQDWLSNTQQLTRLTYVWQKDGSSTIDWTGPYRVVHNANIVLDGLMQYEGPASHTEQERLVGSALFYRAFAFYELAQVFAKGYDRNTAKQDLGIPLRLNSDYNIPSVRSSVYETYNQIVVDVQKAYNLLPLVPVFKTRPSKPAALALLARTYMAMQDHANAGLYADSCLSLYNTLMNYNIINAASATPFKRFNEETIFYATTTATQLLSQSRSKVDSVLYNFFDSNDLRKNIFFRNNGDGSYTFKGGYDDHLVGSVFKGLTTDEMYLVSAECNARAGLTSRAMATLNTLLITRWKTGAFIPLSARDSAEALLLILKERRKQLIFRGLRWTDLRRLNKEPALATTLYRILNGVTYSLPPNDPAYVMMIPDLIIENSTIQQNVR